MNIISSQGIVLRNIKYSETSVIIEVLTRDLGLKSFIISNVRSSKSQHSASMFQVMTIINISFRNKDNENLIRPGEYSYGYKYKSIFKEVLKTSVGIFLIECTRNSIKEKEQNKNLYEFIYQKFITLDELPNSDLTSFYIHYLISFTSYLGFGPHNNYSHHNDAFDLLNGVFTASVPDPRYGLGKMESKFLSDIINGILPSKPIQPALRNSITDALMKYYSLHVEGFRNVKSLEILRELMS